jgi:glucose uptake protein
MYQPETYGIALLLMLISMTCWGSWANTMKLTPGWRFQLFYWDYVLGVLLMSLIWGLTLGSMGGGPLSFLNNLGRADARHITYGLLGGAVFNVANLLLVAAIEIAGLAVAFPMGIGVALVEGVVISYILIPRGHPVLLFGGLLFVVVAIVLDAMAYRRKEAGSSKVSSKGIGLSIAAGILMGFFYPFVTKATTGQNALGPYAVGFIFALGILICTIPANAFLMWRPLTGDPISRKDYFGARATFHLFAIAGGLIWCTGTVLNFVPAHARIIGPAVSYAIGNGATMVSAMWGVVVWREFAHAPTGTGRLLALMFAFFLVGLGAIAISPVFHF